MHLVELSYISYITLIIVDSPSHIAGYIPMTVLDPPVLMVKLPNSQANQAGAVMTPTSAPRAKLGDIWSVSMGFSVGFLMGFNG